MEGSSLETGISGESLEDIAERIPQSTSHPYIRKAKKAIELLWNSRDNNSFITP